MRTSIDIPDELFRRVKAYSALQGLKLKDVVVRALKREIGEPNSEEIGPGLEQFRGILNLEEDPMEIQRRLRSEWP